MPIRRLNSTGRKRILREDAHIRVEPGADGVLVFYATLALADYDLPPEALVSVEAYRQMLFMRFAHGTVASPVPPAGSSCRLTEFATRDGLLFRVKVTSTTGRPGILLAEADRIPVRDDEDERDHRTPLLPPVPAEIGEEVWKVEFSEDSGPQLLVNQNVGDWKAVTSSAEFRSLVFPSAMREVLLHAVVVHESRDEEDPNDWGCRWLRFAHSLPGVGPLPQCGEGDDFDVYQWMEWIDQAVAAFSRRHQMLAHYTMHRGDELQ